MSRLNGISRAKISITLFDENNKRIRVDMNTQQEIGREVIKALRRVSFKPFYAIYNDPEKILMDFIRGN